MIARASPRRLRSSRPFGRDCFVRRRPGGARPGSVVDPQPGVDPLQSFADGRALLDAARDAANRWLFTEQLDDATRPWAARLAAFNGSPSATHAVDVTGFLDHGIASLRAHRMYLTGLGDAGTDPDGVLRGTAESVGARQGVEHAVAFEVVPL